MDPSATWKRLREAMTALDRPEIAQAADDLIGWIRKGGFIPAEVVETLGTDERKPILFYLHGLRAVAEMP